MIGDVRISLVRIVPNQALGLVHQGTACMFRTMERRNLLSSGMPVCSHRESTASFLLTFQCSNKTYIFLIEASACFTSSPWFLCNNPATYHAVKRTDHGPLSEYWMKL